MREIYYTHVTHFRSQRECDSIIVDVCNLLNVERVHLGLFASPKGYFCGSFVITEYTESKSKSGTCTSTSACSETRRNKTSTIDGTSLSSIQGIPITREWIYRSTARAVGAERGNVNVNVNAPSFKIQSNAKCILIIEKEGVYLRLTEDRFFERYPCIIITGKGYPDIATRALVHVLYTHLSLPDDDFDEEDDFDDEDGGYDCDVDQNNDRESNTFGFESEVTGDSDDMNTKRRPRKRRKRRPIPIYGVSDCNPFGFHIIQTFYRGSDKRYCDGGERYSVPIQWLGLRPSLVSTLKDENALPKEVYQSLTDLDKKKIDKLCHETNTFVHRTDNDGIGGGGDERRLEELELMQELGYKVELESLHWLGMDYITNWLFDTLVVNENHQKLMIEKEKKLHEEYKRRRTNVSDNHYDDNFDIGNEDVYMDENDFTDIQDDEYDLRLAI